MNRSRRNVRRYLNADKTQSEINNLKNVQASQPHHWSTVRSWIGKTWNWAQRTNRCWSFILQYATQRMLELYYSFFKKFCDADKNEELEMDTDSSYMVLSEEKLDDGIPLEKQDEWKAMRCGDCTDTFTANPTDLFLTEFVATDPWNTLGGNQVSLKKTLDVHYVLEYCVYAVKYIVGMIERVRSSNFAAKVHTSELLKIVAMHHCQNLAKCWTNLSM